MSLLGVNRIVVAVKNLESSKKFYSDVLGATFHEANWTGEEFGIEVAISWDAGIELCAAMPGRENSSAVTQFLANNGEGVINVIFGVTDAVAAKQTAESAGIGLVNSLDYSQEDIDAHLEGMFKKYEEYFLNTSQQCGFSMAVAQIELK